MLPITASGCTAEDANLACLVRAPDIAGHAGEDVRLIRHMTFLLVFARPDPSSQRGSAHPTFAPVAAPSAHARAARHEQCGDIKHSSPAAFKRCDRAWS